MNGIKSVQAAFEQPEKHNVIIRASLVSLKKNLTLILADSNRMPRRAARSLSSVIFDSALIERNDEVFTRVGNIANIFSRLNTGQYTAYIQGLEALEKELLYACDNDVTNLSDDDRVRIRVKDCIERILSAIEQVLSEMDALQHQNAA